ncbi:MAG: FkbM family methyltransferase [Isosphaerales bacterium]
MVTAPVSRWRMSRLWERTRAEGLGRVLSRVIRAWLVGRRIEARGNRVEMSGLVFSVDNPTIHVRMKSTLADGSYELFERLLINRFLPADLPVIELGGAIGVVACFTNRVLIRPEQHIVVEANPSLIPTLSFNRDLNHCQFTVRHAALSYDSDQVDFYNGSTFLAGSLEPMSRRSVRVPSITLGRLLEEAGFPTACLIADIEGAEASLVERESDVLGSRIRWFIFEFHPPALGPARIKNLFAQLQSVGFQERAREGWVVAFENSRVL